MSRSRIRAIPPIPAGTDPALRAVLSAMAEQIEVLAATRNSAWQSLPATNVAELMAYIRGLQTRIAALETVDAATQKSTTISGFLSATADGDTSAIHNLVLGTVAVAGGTDYSSASGTVT